MKATALRLHGAGDLRLDEFELPLIKDDEILVEVITDSICMSTYKCAVLGEKHKRVPENVSEHPTIMGHEFSGNIIEVGRTLQNRFTPGMKFTLQPALNYKGSMWSPGYSYEFFGGDATYCIIPREVMELGCLLEYHGEAYYEASLAEPMSCSIGAFHASYHTSMGVYKHSMGIKEYGKTIILAGAGPMGLGAVDYALHNDIRPSLLVVADINRERLERAAALFPTEEAAACGVTLLFINLNDTDDPVRDLKAVAGGGFDDVFVYSPIKPLIELASRICGRDACLNFFAGPTDTQFEASINFYDVHYNSAHIMGTTGGNTDDMIESLQMTADGRIHPAIMVTHIGGLNAAGETTLNLPNIPGGKKLIYTHIYMPLTAITDFPVLGKTDQRFAVLAEICGRHKDLWCPEAEQYLLEHWK